MDFNSIRLLSSFFIFSSLTFLAHTRLDLDHSDYNAFMIIQSDLGIKGHHPSFTSKPCNSSALSCERRVFNYTSVLKITRIVFESEKLRGFLSPLIGQLPELRQLILPNNHLVDQVPKEIVGCRKLQVLNLKNNHFSGPVPLEFSKLAHLKELDLSSNRFSGNLNFLTHFPKLEKLSLADNHFIGKIPPSLRSFQNLQFFDISGNEYIQGSVPDLYRQEDTSSELSRKSLVLKRYRFTENSTRNSNHSSPAANEVSRNSSSAPVPAPSPSAVIDMHHRKGRNLEAWALGFVAGGAVVGTLGIMLSVLVKVVVALIRAQGKGTGLVIFSPKLIKKAEDLAFLKKKDGLESLQLIGKGGSGEVYKAELPGSNGRMIAIKQILELPKEAAELTEEESRMLNKRIRQIHSEIQIVGRIRHRNLLPLLAHVPRPDCHYLVYEYMKNGSLEGIMRDVAQGNREFNWTSRYRIALGVAAGLEYLHMNNTPRIIHRDLKPANILLDDEMEPRIADFGLAKEMPVENTHMSTSHVAGTVGYIAPEYHQTVKFTDKCDIYSFGVVLGALVMGKLPDDEFFQNTQEVSLVKWMRNVMTSEKPKRALDPNLMGNGHEEQMLQVLKISCFCTLDDPKQRPNSKDVRWMLSQITHHE